MHKVRNEYSYLRCSQCFSIFAPTKKQVVPAYHVRLKNNIIQCSFFFCLLVAEKIEINLINVFPPLIIIHKKTNEKTSPTMLPYITRKTYVINSCEIQHSNTNYDRFPAYFIQTKYASVPGRFTL